MTLEAMTAEAMTPTEAMTASDCMRVPFLMSRRWPVLPAGENLTNVKKDAMQAL